MQINFPAFQLDFNFEKYISKSNIFLPVYNINSSINPHHSPHSLTSEVGVGVGVGRHRVTTIILNFSTPNECRDSNKRKSSSTFPVISAIARNLLVCHVFHCFGKAMFQCLRIHLRQ